VCLPILAAEGNQQESKLKAGMRTNSGSHASAIISMQ